MKKLFRYLWALPATVLGLVCLPLALMSGGTFRVVDGVIEIWGGLVTLFLQRGMLVIGSAAAMTLGHVVLGQDEKNLVRYRRHERVHVAQYERWGLLMIPLYLIFSASAHLSGRHSYWDNRFEIEAYAMGIASNE
jgi:hypothetical protein